MRYLLLLMLLQPRMVAGQDSLVSRFIHYLNEFNVDSLDPLLSDDFTWERTFSKSKHDKNSLFDKYIPYSRNYNPGFVILNTISKGNTVQLLVQDKSDYLKYLGIKEPQWKLFFSLKDGKIVKLITDTTASSPEYFREIGVKSGKFESWLEMHYPGELNEKVYLVPGLLIRRLKEFTRQEDSH